MPLLERLQIMSKRKDWDEYASQPHQQVWKLLKDCRALVSLKEYFGLGKEESRMLVKTRKMMLNIVYTISEGKREFMERLFCLGIRPQVLPCLSLVAYACGFNAVDIEPLVEKGYKFLMARDTFDWMLAKGFQLDRNVIWGLRKEDCHVLEELPSRSRS